MHAVIICTTLASGENVKQLLSLLIISLEIVNHFVCLPFPIVFMSIYSLHTSLFVVVMSLLALVLQLFTSNATLS